MIPSPTGRHSLFLAAGAWVLLATIVGRAFTALTPGLWDARLFAYIGRQWAAGLLPYRDLWDHKPPGIYAVNALAFAISDHGFVVLAILEAGVVLGTVALIFVLVRLFKQSIEVALLGSVAAAAAMNLSFYGERGNMTELYLLLPAVGSMICFVLAERSGSRRWFLLAGFCAGAAALFKPVGLAPLLAQWVWLLARVVLDRREFRVLLLAVPLGLAGAALAWLPAILFFWQQGALAAMLDASFTYNLAYSASLQQGTLRGLASQLLGLTSTLAPVSGLVLLSLLGLWLRFREQEPPDTIFSVAPLAFIWVLVDLLGALAGGRNFHHYFLPLAASLAVAAAVSAGAVMQGFDAARQRRIVLLLLAFLMLGPTLVFHSLRDAADAAKLALLRERPEPAPAQRLAEAINRHARPGDTLFVWDYLPDVYYRTGLSSPVRELFAFRAYHLQGDRRSGHQRAVLAQLQAAPPEFLLDGLVSGAAPQPDDAFYARFAEFRDRLYEPILHDSGFTVYRRRR